jgi:serine/threonine-protein kinase
MIGTTVSHYKIIEKLGEGGMGVVFKAEDTKLDRFVALKFLPPHLSADEDARARFIQEAKAASSLDHPNIAMIHEIGVTSEGRLFIVMPYYGEETLKDQVSQGPMPVEDVVVVGLQAAVGLAKAHDMGIVHRDIKPANLIMTGDGVLKIVDFGLAKLSGAAKLTKTGTTTGTAAYMSPEQVRSESVDHRTDIWSLGVTMYEMLTGRLPFKGDYEQALMFSIVNEDPEPVTGVRSNAPMELERIITKAMQKDPRDRYQHIDDVIADLRVFKKETESGVSRTPTVGVKRRGKKPMLTIAGAAIAVAVVVVSLTWQNTRNRGVPNPPGAGPGGFLPSRTSIAVLPLENLSGDPDQEYFADGMTDALIADLAKIGDLRVISRTSIMQYKDARKPLPEIARELKVSAIVEGSVLRSGDRVRITAQLIDAATDEHIWADTYERDLSNVLALQSSVAKAIVEKVKVTLTPQDKQRLESAPTVNPEAHEAYLRARYHWNRRTEEGFKKAREYFQHAIDIDSTYGPAWAGLAETFVLMGEYRFLSARESFTLAEDAAAKALALDGTLSEAHTAMAAAKLGFRWDFSESEKCYRQAIEFNPNYATAHQWYAEFLYTRERFEEALAHIMRAQELDPLSLIIHVSAGWCYRFLEQTDQARTQAQRALDLNPNFAPAHRLMGWIHLDDGKYDDAIAEFKKTPYSLSNYYLADLGYAYGLAGRRSDALEILDDLKAETGGRLRSPYSAAMVHLGLGEKAEAMRWLEKGYEERDIGMIWIKSFAVFSDSLGGDPGFVELVEKIGLGS